MKLTKCKCGNSFEYMTIFNQIKCLKCGEMIEVEPCTEEELNPPKEVEEVSDGTRI